MVRLFKGIFTKIMECFSDEEREIVVKTLQDDFESKTLEFWNSMMYEMRDGRSTTNKEIPDL